MKYILMLTLFLLGTFFGSWLVNQEKNNIANFAVSNVEDQLEARAFDTRTYLDLLVATQKGKTDLVKNILINKVKVGLEPLDTSKIIEDSELSKLSKPNEKTVADALDYQRTYCENKCLGL